MTSITVPAYCPTCRKLVPSGLSMGGQSKIWALNSTTACEKGHVAHVIDGFYELANGILQIEAADPQGYELLKRLQSLAQAAADGRADPRGTLDEISRLLPPESSAAVMEIGAKNPLAAILIILYILAPIISAVAAGVSAFKAEAPHQTIINNYIRTINPTPEANNLSAPKPLKKEQIRRIKQMQRKKEKVTGENRSRPKRGRKQKGRSL